MLCLFPNAHGRASRAGDRPTRLGVQLAAVGILEKHAGADDLVAPFEDLEHGLQRRLEVQDRRRAPG